VGLSTLILAVQVKNSAKQTLISLNGTYVFLVYR